MNVRFTTLAGWMAIAIAPPAYGQLSLVFPSTPSVAPIPLNGSQAMTLDSNGELRATCVLQLGTTSCQGIEAVGSGPVPTNSISTSGLIADSQGRLQVAGGQQVMVTRTIGNAAEVCVATATSTAAATGWDTITAPAATSTASVTFGNAGEATLGLRCYNLAGAAATTAQLRFIVSGSGGGGSCSHPQIRPAGLTEYAMTWQQVFERAYPGAPGYLIPLGSFTPQRSMDGPLSRSMYLAISFTAQTGVVGNIAFAGSQPIPVVGYTDYRPGVAFVTVSPCAGDFRTPDESSTDPFVRNCRFTVEEGALFFGNSAAPGPRYCQLQPGQTYYLNVVMAPPGSVNGFVNSCNAGLQRCEVNAQPR